MLDSIGSSGFMPPPPPSSSSSTAASLTSDQQSLIEETLANYDADNLSAEDAQSIVDSFSEAGITPSAEFAEALEASGFDAREIGSLANVGGSDSGRPPPPPSDSESGVDLSSIVDYLDELGTDTSAEDASTSSLAAKLAEQFGLSEGQSLINVTA